MRVLYFAYGSNMSGARLRSRVPSAKTVGRALLKDWMVVFNKLSKDGTGKANLAQRPGAKTWGVLYEIDVRELDMLDRAEGGYQRVTVQVCKPDEGVVEAVTYISETLTDDPTAAGWYKKLLLSGAREHNLPPSYIAYLEGLPVKSERTAG